MKKHVLFFSFLYLFVASVFGQAPLITYSSPQTYTIGTPIINLIPNNVGGVVPSNYYSQVTTFSPASIGYSVPSAVAADQSGNVYVADAGNNLIRKITPAGVTSIFVPASAGLSNPQGIATDAAGNVYVSNSAANQILKVTPAGIASVFAGTGGYGSANGNLATATFKTPSGLATDGSGNVYVADFGSNEIRKITPSGTVSTLAGNGTPGNKDGAANSATFNGPLAVACDKAGNVYVADEVNNLIRKISVSNGQVTTIAGNGTAGYKDGTGTSAVFNSPYGLTVDGLGNIYVADSGNSLIRKITTAQVVTTIAGDTNFALLDGLGTSAEFSFPTGVSIDGQGNLFVADDFNNAIREIKTTGFFINNALPAGLNFGANGVISGSPAVVSPQTTYTISAYNLSGSCTTMLTLTVMLADASLSNLTVSSGALNPSFISNNTSYGMSVPNGTTSITVTPTAAGANSTITVNGVAVNSGALSAPVNLTVGSNAITIKVTAQDGVTIQNYTLAVFRAAAQTPAPSISYSSPKIYAVGTAIANLSPTNSGGPVPANAYSLVSTFAGSSAGFNNPNGLAADQQGNVYVADYANNVVKKITPAGTVSTFVPLSAGLSGPQGIAVDAYGNVYIGDSGNNIIRKVTPAGVITTFAGNGTYGFSNGISASATFETPGGLAIDHQGNLYVADFGNNAIRKITPDGTVSTLAGTGTSGATNGVAGTATFNGPFGIACDNAGNVYVADKGNNLIRKISSGMVSTFAGSGAAGFADGTGTAATFSTPYGVAVDGLGNVYVADADFTLIRQISPAGVVKTVAGDTNYGYTDGLGVAAEFSYPTGITIDAAGDLFISDSGNNAIREMKTTGYVISPALPAGLNFDATTGVISGTPTAASSQTVYTISAYNLGGSSSATTTITVISYVSDATLSNLTVSAGTLNGTFAPSSTNYGVSVPNSISSLTVTATANSPTATLKVNGVSVVSGTPSAPLNLSAGGNLINITVTAQDGVTVQTYSIVVNRALALPAAPKISYSGPKVYTVGTAIPNLTPLNIGGAVPAVAYAQVSTLVPPSTGIKSPYGITVDPQGNVFVADYGNNVIRKITPSGVVSVFAGNGVTGYIDGTGTASSFNTPYGVASDGLGNIYVGDSGNNVIRKITPSGIVSTFAGNGMFGYQDGSPTAAEFQTPAGLTIDASGNLYVCDFGNNIIRKILPDGTVSTLAGSGNAGAVNAQGKLASFKSPFGVACDQAGNVYVADQGNNLIRKITPAGNVTTFAGSGNTGFSEGPAGQADFNTPTGVAVDATGNVYVADAAISVVRLISTAGIVSVLAGTGDYGLVDGPGLSALFAFPTGIAADAQGNLFVSDHNNNAIREVRSTGYIITPALPAGLSFDNTTGLISGIPTTASPNTLYTITAYNTGGNSIATVSITVVKNLNDASLKNLTTNAGALNPNFDPTLYSYSNNVGSAVSSITVTPTVNYVSATVKVNGASVTSGSPSAAIPLSVGLNTITVKVTAQDGATTQTYTITVTRAAPLSTNNNLNNLTISSGTLAPPFFKGTTSYTASVNTAITNLTVTPTVADPNATVTVNGVAVTIGTASSPISLAVGSNTITTIVTAQDGATQTYTIVVTRAAPLSSNNNLSNLTISSGTLTPGFNPGTNSYTSSVNNATTTVTATPTAADFNATVTINGVAATSGTASSPISLAVGSNTVTAIVTAQDGTTQTYTIVVTRAAPFSSNNNLSNLTISSGTLSPVFNPGTSSYTASVSNTTIGVTLTPITSDLNATVTVNGIAVTSGTASSPISLAVGSNTITTIVTAQDGATQTYTIVVTRAAPLSSNNNLSNLTISSGTLAPGFNSGTNSYTASVSNATTNVTATPTVADLNATVTINGVPVTSGTASSPISLAVGSNTITTIVTAQDGTTQTYTIVVTRAAPLSSNNNLSNLTISSGTLAPGFNSGTNSYTASVNNAVTNLTVTPTAADLNATVTVNGVAVTSGTASSPISLAVGSNTITTIVTAQDGTTQTYTIVVTRAAPLSSNNNLSNLTISSGTLAPGFNSGTNSYTASVNNAVTNLTVTPTAADLNATVTVNGVAATSGTASSPISLAVGSNTITTIVTAQDGTTRTYTIVVTRAAPLSSNNNLSNLTISSGTLAPGFNSGTNSYTASVSNSTTNLTVTPTVADLNATVTVNGVAVTSGTASSPISLAVGSNTITTIVTAQDGTTQTYTIVVTRAAPLSSNNNLSNLTINSGTLTPGFNSGINSYTTSVNNATTNVTVTPTVADLNATVTVNGVAVTSGTASSPISLAVGSNTITTIVTAQDGTTQTYTIVVTRAAPLSSNNNLSNLTISSGTLVPGFNSGTNSYTASVSNATINLTVTPTVADLNATVTVNGIAATSGTASSPISLAVGSNTITTIVTAQDGATQTYTIVVTRAAPLSSNSDLADLTISSGTLAPPFTPGHNNYTASVSNSTSSITVTPTSSAVNARVTVNGMFVVSGNPSAPISLLVGPNNITTIVNAQDGSTQVYTITITRAAVNPSSDASLGNLTISSGMLTPSFTAGTLSYSASETNATSVVTLTPATTNANATVTVNGKTVNSGSASAPIQLAVGDNTVTIVVTAQDGTMQTYTVNVVRAALSPDANLISLTVSDGTLTPAFVPAITSYAVSVNFATTAVTITPTASSSNATITVNNVPTRSGSASLPVKLQVGNNVVRISVTAQDGTVQTYTVVVRRAAALIAVNNMFTPNGDGINDTWTIPGIDNYPACTVKVFSRSGQLVFSSVGYGAAWDGTFNNQKLPNGTYYYIIDLKQNIKLMAGYVAIVR